MRVSLTRGVPLKTAGNALTASLLLGTLFGFGGILFSLTNPSAPLTRVRAVFFSGNQPVATDAGMPYLGPQWCAGDCEGSHPVCYKTGQRVRLGVELEVDRWHPSGPVWVVGRDMLGTEFRGEGWIRNNQCVINDLRASRNLPARVRVYEPYEIAWRVSFNGGRSYVRAGITQHRLYVTLDAPRCTPLHESVLDISCRAAAGGSNQSDVVWRIWRAFAARTEAGELRGIHCRQWSGQLLRYWLTEDQQTVAQNHSVEQLLQTGVGTCQAWTELLQQALQAQGVAGVETVCVVPPPGCAGFVMRAGLRAQGNAHPPRYYVNHALVEWDRNFYDPSYGNGPYRGATETAAIAAWRRSTVAGVLYRDVAHSQTMAAR